MPTLQASDFTAFSHFQPSEQFDINVGADSTNPSDSATLTKITPFDKNDEPPSAMHLISKIKSRPAGRNQRGATKSNHVQSNPQFSAPATPFLFPYSNT
jgi:hypothetical protein